MEAKRLYLGPLAFPFQPVLPVQIGKAFLANKYMLFTVAAFLSVLQKPFDQRSGSVRSDSFFYF